MTLSGPSGEWLDGVWNLTLPVDVWVVWLADGTIVDSTAASWDDVPDRILGVCVFHSKNRKTWMYGVDGYPDPNGGPIMKMGEQIGEEDSMEWLAAFDNMKREAEEWQQHII